MNITKVTEEDINQIILLEEEAFGESLGYDILHDSILHPNISMICMKEDLKVLGYLGAYVFEEDVEFLNFVVDKKYRGSGIGTKLINYFLDNNEYNKFILDVRVSNTNAIKFYQNKGFKQISIRKHYYANGEDAYVMSLERGGK